MPVRNRRKSVVALLAEGVDRNFYITQITNADWTVALLAEGVDRNFQVIQPADEGVIVALLAEGVDRNSQDGESEYKGSLSPSPRRAWIEI